MSLELAIIIGLVLLLAVLVALALGWGDSIIP